MRTALLTLFGCLSLAACSSSPPPETNTSASSAAATSGGASSSGAGASSGSTGAGASTAGAGSSGSTGGSSTGGATSSGSSTGASVQAGSLWIGGANALSPSELGASSTNPPWAYSCPPVAALSSPAQGGAEAIDGAGDLWTQFYSSQPSNGIYMWSPSELVAGCGSRKPARTLNTQAELTALAFDASGNLWGSVTSSNEIVGYAAANLQSDGSIGPSYLLTSTTGAGVQSIFNPSGLAFDTTNTLWIGNYYSILAYHTATLAQATTQSGGNSHVPPDLVLTTSLAAGVESDGGLFNQYVFQWLAFDSSGDLWVTVQNYLDGGTPEAQIVEYSADQLSNLGGNSTPTPVFTINQTSAEGASFPGWSGIAFDATGNLWGGAHLAAPNLFRFPFASLSTNGTPDVIITAQGDTTASRAFTLAFDPIPKGLPIKP